MQATTNEQVEQIDGQPDVRELQEEDRELFSDHSSDEENEEVANYEEEDVAAVGEWLQSPEKKLLQAISINSRL